MPLFLNVAPDLRTIIQWQPELNCDDAGTLNIEIITGSEPGNYLISMQGVTESGRPINQQFQINWKN